MQITGVDHGGQWPAQFWRLAACALGLLMWSVAASAGERGPAASIDSLFAAVGSSTPGAAVLVIKDGRVVFERGYGVTDLRTLHKIDAHSNFRLASLTKQFTAMAVMLLVHDGKLRYTESLSEVFPEFPAYGRSITIRDLLNHTSGLLDYEDLMAKQYGDTADEQIPQIHDAGVLALLEKVGTTKFPPGTKWEYSNSGYCVLAMVVERVSGKPFGDFLRERIFAPLLMKHTLAYERGKNEVPSRAYGHTPQGASWRETDQSSTSATLGDGGVYTSVADLALWDRALRQHTLLSNEEMKPALVAAQPSGGSAQENGHAVSYGFGWFVDPYRGHPRMWHYGETVGFRTSIQRFPGDGLTVIVLANRADFAAPELALKISDLYLHDSKDSFGSELIVPLRGKFPCKKIVSGETLDGDGESH
jgi:CubicO group peptidase (beta-lactamase class C family)